MLIGRRGFTLAELVVALVLFGVFAGAVARLLVHLQHQYQRQVQQWELQATLRTATGLLVQELRELDATDPAGSDLLEPGDSSITYRAMRGMYATCRSSDGLTLYLDTTVIGLRGVEAEYDSVLILALPSAAAGEDRWSHADVTGVSGGTDCPGGRPSLRVDTRTALAPAESVFAGSPVRVFEIAQWRAYRDATGDWWLGERRYQKSSGWNVFQPVAGPLEPRGLRFTYYGNDGSVAEPQGPGVSRIEVTIVGRSPEAVRLSAGVRYLVDSLVAGVALRNNQR